MTFEELEQTLPNGFHDAEISNIAISYGSRSVVLKLNLWTSLPDGPDHEQYRSATLTVPSFFYCTIEPPAPDHFTSQAGIVTVAGYSEDGSDFPLFRQVKSLLPANAFCCRFYVHDWNAFIRIAGPTSEFSWSDADRN